MGPKPKNPEKKHIFTRRNENDQSKKVFTQSHLILED
jgi:hypothetical protein